MKKYTHAWLAFMAVKRIATADIPSNYKKRAASFVNWFMNHRDFVLQGAWYPDAVIKDMSTGHVLKYKHVEEANRNKFKKLPREYHIYEIGKQCDLYKKPFKIIKGNVADRCEAIVHSIVDNYKMQESEDKGSPITPTDNHIATLFFMLSHYIADAHMPLHCDYRAFSNEDDIHAYIEKKWDEQIRDCYKLDFDNERFFYNAEGYPLKIDENEMINWVENEISQRPFTTGFGSGNHNAWDFISAITQYSYLTAYRIIPEQYDENNLNKDGFNKLFTEEPLFPDCSFDDFSKYIFIDAIDSIAKIWFYTWNKYQKWFTR